MKNEALIKLVQDFSPWDAQEAADRESALRALSTFEDILSRDNPIIHLCASPWIMSRDMKSVLLVYHRLYDSWGWCGGHCDGDEDLCAVALLAAGVLGLLVVPRESSTVYSRAKPMKTSDLLVTLRVGHPTAAWRTICLTRLFASAGVMLAVAYVWFVVRYRGGVNAGLDLRLTMTMVALMGLLACAMALLGEGVTDLLRASFDNDRLVLMIGIALAIVAAVVPLVSYTTAGLYVFAGIGGFAIHMIDDALQSLAVASVPQVDRAAEYLAVFNTSATLGRLLGVVVGGFVFAYAGVFSSVFLWVALMFAFAGACGAASIVTAAKR